MLDLVDTMVALVPVVHPRTDVSFRSTSKAASIFAGLYRRRRIHLRRWYDAERHKNRNYNHINHEVFDLLHS